MATAYIDSDDESTAPRTSAGNTQIQVYARIKPSSKTSTAAYTIDDHELTLKYNTEAQKQNDYVNNTRDEFLYRFEHTLDQSTTQQQVFDTIAKPVVDSVLSGYNGTIFAYGQTGSGKTYTITGGTNSYEDRGIIPRALDYIYKYVANDSAKRSVSYTIKISYMEIYNENGYDLLHPDHDSSKLDDLPKVTIHEKNGEFVPSNIYTFPASNLDDALNLLFVGDTNRIICETPSNDVSTRSHCIFTVFVESRELQGDKIRYSKLNLVDLAGSERIKKTGITGKIQVEARYINLSLHYLEQLIVALHHVSQGKATHLPYRNSMMTMMLRDSLGGNCRTTMIATMSMQESHMDETVSTARFAQRVALIRNSAVVNEVVDTAQLIKSLKMRVKQQNEAIAVLKGQQTSSAPLTDADIDACKAMVQQYIGDTSNSVALHLQASSKVEKCFEILKSVVLSQQLMPATGAPQSNGNQISNLLAGTVNVNSELAKLRLAVQQKDKEIGVLVQMLKANESSTAPTPASTLAVQTAELAQLQKRGTDAGVDAAVLAERARLFEQFRRSYRKNEVIEANKLALQQKYVRAKQLGDEINGVRSQINALKATVEHNRLNRGVSALTSGGVAADGDAGGADSDAAVLHQIEQCKSVYQSRFVELKALKGEIEHEQAVLEKSRRQLQADFDVFWQKQQQQQGGGGGSSNGGVLSDVSNGVVRPLSGAPVKPISQPPVQQQQHQSQPAVQYTPQQRPPSSGVRMHASSVKSVVPAMIPSTTLPSTGNAQADADIAAFYRMRDQLVAAQRGGQG